MLPFLKDLPMQYRHQGKVAERTGNTPDYVSPGGAYLTGSASGSSSAAPATAFSSG